MNFYKIKIYFKFLGLFTYYKTYKVMSHAIINTNLLEMIDLEYNRVVIPIINISKFKLDKDYTNILNSRNNQSQKLITEEIKL